MTNKTPIAYEFHNYKTGHCYVDYVERQGMGESDGYTKIELFRTSLQDRSESVAIKFGRWLMKNANSEFESGALCWQLLSDKKYYNTDELYKKFFEEM